MCRVMVFMMSDMMKMVLVDVIAALGDVVVGVIASGIVAIELEVAEVRRELDEVERPSLTSGILGIEIVGGD